MVPVLNDVAAQVFGCGADTLTLPPDATIYLPCLRNVDKLVKLRNDLSAKEDRINQQVKQAGERIRLQTLGFQSAETLGSHANSNQPYK